jgi:diguanylate cyclase (GGDEF)-like protein
MYNNTRGNTLLISNIIITSPLIKARMETTNTPRKEQVFFKNITSIYIGLIFVQLILTQIRYDRFRAILSDVIYPFFLIPSITLLFIAAHNTVRKSTRLSLAWYAFSASILFNALGDILCSTLENSWGATPYPSIADLFYLLSYPLFLTGTFLIPHKKPKTLDTVKKILDTSTILLSFVFIFWNLIIGPHISIFREETGLAYVISLVYPVGNVLILWALALLIYNNTEHQDRRSLLLMACGMFFNVITDSFFGYQTLKGTYIPGGILELGWTLGYLMFLRAAILQIRWINQDEWGDTSFSSYLLGFLEKVEKWAPYFPYLFAITPFIMILWEPTLSIPLSPFALAVWAAGLITLVFTRQAISIHENSTLNRNLNNALALVQDKSKALELTNQELQHEISEHQVSKKQLIYKALHDCLTGLPNRAYLLERLGQMLEFSRQYAGARFAVLYLDCDHFKVVNDSQGHTIGDQLLMQIASRLESCIRSNDLAGRIGGDEFVVLLCENCNEAGIIKVANRILEVFSKPFLLVTGKKINVSISIGIVDRLENYDQPEDILRDADIAMYYAKSAGRNRYEFYKQGMREKIVFKLDVEHDLVNALERNEFELHYQPILLLKDLQVTGFEALIRWRHPSRGLIAPMDFIPICEETGLIHKVGAWVMKEACLQVTKWRAENPAYRHLNVHVNVSGNQVCHPHFIKQVTQIIKKTGADPEALHLEITENVFIKNSKKVAQTFWELLNIGVESEIDDFGSGYSSLKYLQDFPIRNIKIDRGFINTIQPGQNPEVIRAILAMVHNLDIQLTAEGIETEYQLNELRRLGCHFGQGYLFSKPLDLAGAKQYLEENIGRIQSTGSPGSGNP